MQSNICNSGSKKIENINFWVTKLITNNFKKKLNIFQI